ncbi:AbiEi antitoxin N-terminal domain-containing protein [Brevundimonas abyssalis]|uniref:AbiEi antitoxin N-terminal domain-containing protein n=1 Tax=Brevundimonas abyssalis TaxID=1125965 RepID=UPI00190F647B|nr:AbiEi antitoxin N-terminal domain-containing protein [Brevundimonas abyssalis]
MDALRGQKLKHVLDSAPPGFLVDSRWLKDNGVGRSSASAYAQAGWLERVRPGLYRRPFGAVEPIEAADWRIAVLSAQRIMGYDFHVGGMTALALDGRSHYLPLGSEAAVYLYGEPRPGCPGSISTRPSSCAAGGCSRTRPLAWTPSISSLSAQAAARPGAGR